MNYKKQKELRDNYREDLKHQWRRIHKLYSTKYKFGDPITTIIPQYWNKIEIRAIKDVMFERRSLDNFKHPKYTWMLRDEIFDMSMDAIVDKVMGRIDDLKQIVYKKNDWKVPCKLSAIPQLFFEFRSESFHETGELISFKEFFEKYTKELEDEELVYSIYTAIKEAFNCGKECNHLGSVGEAFERKEESEELKNNLINVYNDIDQALANIKKIIDNE